MTTAGAPCSRAVVWLLEGDSDSGHQPLTKAAEPTSKWACMLQARAGEARRCLRSWSQSLAAQTVQMRETMLGQTTVAVTATLAPLHTQLQGRRPLPSQTLSPECAPCQCSLVCRECCTAQQSRARTSRKLTVSWQLLTCHARAGARHQRCQGPQESWAAGQRRAHVRSPAGR